MQQETHRLIQLTDLHIGEHREFRLAGIPTYESFRQVLAAVVEADTKPDMLMVTGDVAAAGDARAYQLFAEQIKFVDIPYAWLPGNHDDFEIMQSSITSAPYWPLLEFGDWRVVSLNTAIAGQVGGALVEQELAFLSATLQAESDHPVIIFLHHPPIPVGCDWLDQQRISNAAALADIIGNTHNVRAIFCGHVHQEFTAQWAGCPVYTTPSTCFQFAGNSQGFAMSDDLPGYRWIELRADGRLETGVHHLKSTTLVVDHQLAGY